MCPRKTACLVQKSGAIRWHRNKNGKMIWSTAQHLCLALPWQGLRLRREDIDRAQSVGPLGKYHLGSSPIIANYC